MSSNMSDMKTAAVEIVRRLRERGHQAYLVGGCVRDVLLGREPADYDVSTDATPEQVMRIFPQTYEVGAQFGVVLVPVKSLREAVGVPPFASLRVGHQEQHPDTYPEEHAGAIEV